MKKAPTKLMKKSPAKKVSAGSVRMAEAILKKAGKERKVEELDRARLQSLFTQGRMQFAADDARFAGRMAQQQALVSAATSIASMGYKMEQITPTDVS